MLSVQLGETALVGRHRPISFMLLQSTLFIPRSSNLYARLSPRDIVSWPEYMPGISIGTRQPCFRIPKKREATLKLLRCPARYPNPSMRVVGERESRRVYSQGSRCILRRTRLRHLVRRTQFASS